MKKCNFCKKLSMKKCNFYYFSSIFSYLIEQIKNCYATIKPLYQPFHEQAIELYTNFLYVGGMPEVVEEFLKNKKILSKIFYTNLNKKFWVRKQH